MINYKKTPSIIVLLLVTAAITACSRSPETFTGSAELGKTCVENAAASYGVSLDYISLDPLAEDPSSGYTYAYQGVATQSSGVETIFLCRLDENKNYVDIVTWVPKD